MTTDLSKLKIAPESKFFKVENGEIYFLTSCHHCDEDFYNIKNFKNKYYKQLISAVGAWDWRKLYDEIKPIKDNEKLYYVAKEQIKLWEGLAE